MYIEKSFSSFRCFRKVEKMRSSELKQLKHTEASAVEEPWRQDLLRLAAWIEERTEAISQMAPADADLHLAALASAIQIKLASWRRQYGRGAAPAHVGDDQPFERITCCECRDHAGSDESSDQRCDCRCHWM